VSFLSLPHPFCLSGHVSTSYQRSLLLFNIIKKKEWFTLIKASTQGVSSQAWSQKDLHVHLFSTIYRHFKLKQVLNSVWVSVQSSLKWRIVLFTLEEFYEVVSDFNEIMSNILAFKKCL
jgi:hypothetical protein